MIHSEDLVTWKTEGQAPYYLLYFWFTAQDSGDSPEGFVMIERREYTLHGTLSRNLQSTEVANRMIPDDPWNYQVATALEADLVRRNVPSDIIEAIVNFYRKVAEDFKVSVLTARQRGPYVSPKHTG